MPNINKPIKSIEVTKDKIIIKIKESDTNNADAFTYNKENDGSVAKGIKSITINFVRSTVQGLEKIIDGFNIYVNSPKIRFFTEIIEPENRLRKLEKSGDNLVIEIMFLKEKS